MARKVVLIHGWSSTSESMHDVRDFLEAHGFDVADIWLSDYLSLDDDIRVADVAKRMQAVLQAQAATLGPSYDMIVHSTGGLVSREWLARFYPNGRSAEGAPCPVERLVMLAPANFGSKLAAAGKSFVGRVIKGWDNWLQSGAQMLTNLELASEFQWSLARRDLVHPDGGDSPYGPGKVLPFVIIGSRGHTHGMEQIVDEDGSEGVVRPCAANLNAIGATIDFSTSHAEPTITPWTARQGARDIPIAILPNRNHSTVTAPRTDIGALAPQVGELLLRALGCGHGDAAAYKQVFDDWAAVSAATAALVDNPAGRQAADPDHPPSDTELHQYLQVIVHVVDDQGYDVEDYFIEFYDPDAGGEEDTVLIHQKVLKDTHKFSKNPSFQCLFVDRTALQRIYYARYDSIAMSLSAAHIGEHIFYFDPATSTAAGHVTVSTKAGDGAGGQGDRLRANRTHLIEIVIPRQPIDDVFKLSQ